MRSLKNNHRMEKKKKADKNVKKADKCDSSNVFLNIFSKSLYIAYFNIAITQILPLTNVWDSKLENYQSPHSKLEFKSWGIDNLTIMHNIKSRISHSKKDHHIWCTNFPPYVLIQKLPMYTYLIHLSFNTAHVKLRSFIYMSQFTFAISWRRYFFASSAEFRL